jgi:DEAD/DEAH box helicase domain-containing protein
VGFSSNRYDVPVLTQYFKKLKTSAPDLWEMDRVDLLEEIELATGERVSLNRLAEVNLGETKTHHGSEAISLYADGNMDELKEYCINDVKLTKDLYDLYRKQHYLLVPDKKTGEIRKVEFAKSSAAPALL